MPPVACQTLHREVEAGRQDAQLTRALTGRWAAEVAHEVRTPLYAIRGLVEDMLGHAPLSEPVRGDVELIDTTIAEAVRLVDEQLAAARQQAGGQIVRLGDVDVAELLHGLRGMMRPLVRPGVTLVVDEPSGLPRLRTDRGKVAQILRNLAANALRHTASGGVRVGAAPDGDATHVVFTARDTGEGIPAAFQERIFHEYAQVPGAENRSGSGLGLPVAAALATTLGGSVAPARNSGQGATFTATVPVVFTTDDPRITVIAEDGGADGR